MILKLGMQLKPALSSFLNPCLYLPKCCNYRTSPPHMVKDFVPDLKAIGRWAVVWARLSAGLDAVQSELPSVLACMLSVCLLSSGNRQAWTLRPQWKAIRAMASLENIRTGAMKCSDKEMVLIWDQLKVALCLSSAIRVSDLSCSF